MIFIECYFWHEDVNFGLHPFIFKGKINLNTERNKENFF